MRTQATLAQRLVASDAALAALDEALTHEHPLPSSSDVVIVGLGLSGLHIANKFHAEEARS